MKKFEEKLEQLKNNSHTNFYGYMGIRLLTEPEIIETFKDWVSPGDYQAEINKLKSQLEKQQPEIPEFVANYIEAAKEDFWTLLSAMDDPNLSSRVGDWLKGGNFRNQEIFAQAWINGYTVAKEKRFYLKNKLTGLYLYKNDEGFSECEKGSISWALYKTEFSQSEIDSVAAASYEQIEVEE